MKKDGRYFEMFSPIVRPSFMLFDAFLFSHPVRQVRLAKMDAFYVRRELARPGIPPRRPQPGGANSSRHGVTAAAA